VQWKNTEHKKKGSHAGGANLMTRSVYAAFCGWNTCPSWALLQ